MAHRQSQDSSGAIIYPAGTSTASGTKNTFYSLVQGPSRLATNGAYNGHAVEIFADGAVFDTVTGTYLFPFRDYNPIDLQRI